MNKKILGVAMATIMSISIVGCSKEDNSNEVVANVNGVEIKMKEYEQNLGLYKGNVEATFGPDVWKWEVSEGVVYEDEFKATILQQMMDMETIYQEAKKLDILPTEEEIEEKVSQINAIMAENKDFKKQLDDLDIDEEFIKKQQEYELMLVKYREHFGEVTEVTEEEQKEFYEENKELYYRDEVKASHILIKTIDDSGNPVSDKDKEKAKKEAEEILEKVKSGEEFSQLAKEYSQDEGSASEGGDLGFFGRNDMVLDFEKAAFALEAGEISELVETEFGYHIIKSYERVDEQQSYEDVAEQVNQAIIGERYTKNIETLIKNAKTEIFEEISKKATM